MKCSVHFIHIKNPKRDVYALPLLEQLASTLGAGKLNSHSFEGNGPSTNVGTFCVLRRELALFFLEQRFRSVVLRKRSRSFIGTLIAFKNHIKHYLFSSELLNKKKRQCSIEWLNLDQHIRALGAFLDSDASFGLFFEDDIIFQPFSGDFVKYAVEEKFFGADYIDLAGGIAINFSRMGSEQEFRSFYSDEVNTVTGLTFPFLFTNTSCGYVLSRRLAMKLYESISLNPSIRLAYPIDWLYNYIFMSPSICNSEFSCLHFQPTPFLHGSKVSYDNPWRA